MVSVIKKERGNRKGAMEPFLLFHRSVVMIVSDEEDVMGKIFCVVLGNWEYGIFMEWDFILKGSLFPL